MSARRSASPRPASSRTRRSPSTSSPTINRGGNCCGIDVIRNARADKNGEAILHFKWPRYYLNGDDRKRWRKGSKVDVIVLGDSGRGLKVVRMKKRR